jgi:hypothetical protein
VMLFGEGRPAGSSHCWGSVVILNRKLSSWNEKSF